jgi:histone H3/H4
VKTEPAELLKDALSLPPEARSAPVESLLESPDTRIDDDAHEAWREEIERRLRQIGSAAASMMAAHDARRLLRGRLPN